MWISFPTTNWYVSKVAAVACDIWLMYTRSEQDSVSTCVQELLCTVSPQQKARWFRDAFGISRLSWMFIRNKWLSYKPNGLSSTIDVDCIDGELPDSDDEELKDQIQLIPDPSSELIQSPELWYILWKWLPEWVICTEPECLFRASQDGYK